MTQSHEPRTWQHASLPYSISDNTRSVDLKSVHDFLVQSYWSKGIPFETFKRSVQGAHCFSLLDSEGNQVGFARVISDHATFAYIGDVYVLEAHRGKGLAKWLMATIMTHPDLQGLRRWTLATRDMHALYRHFGFGDLADPGKLMEFRPERDYG